MIGMILCIFATLLNLGMAIWIKRNYDREMKISRELGKMEGFIEGVKASHEGKVSIKENIMVMN